jgi:hypothetical protein
VSEFQWLNDYLTIYKILPLETISMTVETPLCSHAVTNNAYSSQSFQPAFWSLHYSPCIALCPLLIPCTRHAAPIFKNAFLSRAHIPFIHIHLQAAKYVWSIRAAAAAAESLRPCSAAVLSRVCVLSGRVSISSMHNWAQQKHWPTECVCDQ